MYLYLSLKPQTKPQTKSQTKCRHGFALIEVVIVLAVISVVSLVTAPLGLQFYNSQTIDGLQSQLGDALTRARSQSLVQKDDDHYGVCLNNSGGSPSSTLSYVLYKGASGTACSAHTNVADEIYPILDSTTITFPTTVAYPNIAEINFAKHTGEPNATGTISIVWNGLTRTITVDSLGTIVEI